MYSPAHTRSLGFEGTEDQDAPIRIKYQRNGQCISYFICRGLTQEVPHFEDRFDLDDFARLAAETVDQRPDGEVWT